MYIYTHIYLLSSRKTNNDREETRGKDFNFK